MTRRNFIFFAAGDAEVYGKTPGETPYAAVSYAEPRAGHVAAVPATAPSRGTFLARCVGCQLCVQACPSHVLQLSTAGGHAPRVEMNFARGWCVVECVRCGSVCPAGALKPLEVAQKKTRRMGVAVWDEKACLVAAKGVTCDACRRHCPVQAITADAQGRPVVAAAKCIGCGACEYHCPARPHAALHVEGLA